MAVKTVKKKLKTKKALSKRIKLTATGKALRRKGGKSHLNSGKSSKRKRSLRKPVLVSEEFTKLVKRAMPYG